MITVFPQTRAENSGDRFAFSVFVAIAAHALVIFGIGFKLMQPSPQSSSLEITLAQYATEKPDPEADFLAQANQQGSGELEQPKEITALQETPFEDKLQRETAAPPQQLEQRYETLDRAQLTTSAQTVDSSNTSPEREPRNSEISPAPQTAALLRQIASLKSQLDQQQQAYANKPRTRRLNTVSTVAGPEAAYLFDWQRHIEMVGNQNYPPEARQRKIYGDLRMAVILLPDGSVEDVEILRSSGQRVLDAAAIRIVRLASPFKPLPPEVLGNHDRLEIIRTWRFERGIELNSGQQ